MNFLTIMALTTNAALQNFGKMGNSPEQYTLDRRVRI